MDDENRRWQVTVAPGELRLVQELLNSAAKVDAPDLLDAPDTAARWLAVYGITDGRPSTRGLRIVRDALRRAVGSDDAPVAATATTAVAPSSTVRLRLDADGTVDVATAEGSVAGLTARVLVAVRDAQRDGSWRRLKLCRNPDCRVAFWDGSRNSSGVWHDVRTCGNMANLRASRARRAAARSDA